MIAVYLQKRRRFLLLHTPPPGAWLPPCDIPLRHILHAPNGRLIARQSSLRCNPIDGAESSSGDCRFTSILRDAEREIGCCYEGVVCAKGV